MSTTTATKPQPQAFNSNTLYRELSLRLPKLTTEQQALVNGHVKACTGHTLEEYHGNGASEDDKVALYRECLKAVLTRNFGALRPEPKEEGVIDVPSENKVVPLTATGTESAEEEAEPEQVATVKVDPPQPKPEPKAQPAPVAEPVKPAPVRIPVRQEFGSEDEKIATLVEVIRGIVKPTASSPSQAAPIDEAKIEALIKVEVTRQMWEVKRELLAVMQKEYESNLEEIGNAIRGICDRKLRSTTEKQTKSRLRRLA